MFNSLVTRAAKKAKKQLPYHHHKRQQSPPSPASFTTPEVIEISEQTAYDDDTRLYPLPPAPYLGPNYSTPALSKDPFASTSDLSHDPFASSTSLAPYLVAPRPAPSPSPRINLALPLEPLGIQFPADILGPEAIAMRRRRSGSLPTRGDYPPDGFIAAIPLHGRSALGSKAVLVQDGHDTDEVVEVIVEDPHGNQSGSSSEDLRAGKPPQPPGLINTTHRRPAPTPLRIPGLDAPRRPGLSRRSSDTSSSSENLSAISGTTLAAGVLAGTFRLSVHSVRRTRQSVRQDSATLPQDDHAFHPPPVPQSYWRGGRRLSGGAVVPTPPRSRADSPVPPVPPLPQHVGRSSLPRLQRRASDPTLGVDAILCLELSSPFKVDSPLRAHQDGHLPSPAPPTTTTRPEAPVAPQPSLREQRSQANLQAYRARKQLEGHRPHQPLHKPPSKQQLLPPQRPPSTSMKRASREAPPAALPLSSVLGATPAHPIVAASTKTSTADSNSGESADGTKARRISPISEAKSSGMRSTPSLPYTPSSSRPLHTASSNDASVSSATTSAGVLSDMSPPRARPEPRRARTDILSGQTTASSNDDFDSILNEYSFASPTASLLSSSSSEKTKTHKAKTSPSLTKTMLKSKATDPHRTHFNGALPVKPSRSLPLPRSSLQPLSPNRPSGPRLDEAQDSSPSPSATSDVFDSVLLPPSHLRKAQRLSPRALLTRARTGTPPQPIRVVRDSQDNSYGITLSDGPSSSEHSSTSGGGGGKSTQTFPETPSAMSPLWSALSGPEGELLVPARLARSASLAGHAAAATIRAKLAGGLARSTTVKDKSNSPANPSGLSTLAEQASRSPSPVPPPALPVVVPPTAVEPQGLAPGLDAGLPNHRLSASPGQRTKPLPITPDPSRPSSRNSSTSSSRLANSRQPSTDSLRSRRKLPDPETSSIRSVASSSSFAPLAASASCLSPSLARFAFPPRTPPTLSKEVPPSTLPPQAPVPPNVPASPPLSLLFGDSTVPHASFVAPPAYHIAVSDVRNLTSSPSSEERAGIAVAAPYLLNSPPSSAELPYTRRPSVSEMSDAADGTPSRHARPRRPGPLGPRRPSAGAIGIPPRNASAPAIPTIGHVRQASAARSHSHLRQQPSEVLALPRFKKTPIPWRGYTLEVAKWTFTSEQLQAIVSRAIRQSGEASTLRLMPLEVLDSDVPNELARREAREADLKNTYKYMVRKREGMLASLARATDATHSPDITTVHRMLGELSTLGANMDETVEELHEVSDQIAQLRRLRDVHSYSALAMALRKLNTSFLKQVAETQELRQQIRVLEVERDDAWRQAEDLAQEVDYLDAFMAESARSGTRSAGTPGSSRAATFAPLPLQDDAHDIKVMTATTASARSSRVSASRKTSVRKAGLRRGVSARRSARSSAASATTAGSASRLTFYDDAPPVPPLPLPRRNLAISTTQLHDRLSGSGPTTETPSSEMEAMVLAQRELYDMLGLPRDELLVTSPGQEGRPRSAASEILRRSRHYSTVASAGSPLSARPKSQARDLLSPLPSARARRASLPATPGQVVSFYDSITDERQAMLTTIKLIT